MDALTREFETAVKRCLDAVCKKDEATHSEFFTEEIPFTAIVPLGTFTDVRSYMESQRKKWYAVKTGSFSYRLERIEASGDLGFVLLHATYENVDTEGPFRKDILISNLFRKHQGRWYLSFNQNTVLSTSRSN